MLFHRPPQVRFIFPRIKQDIHRLRPESRSSIEKVSQGSGWEFTWLRFFSRPTVGTGADYQNHSERLGFNHEVAAIASQAALSQTGKGGYKASEKTTEILRQRVKFFGRMQNFPVDVLGEPYCLTLEGQDENEKLFRNCKVRSDE
jgi:hypothetical protein